MNRQQWQRWQKTAGGILGVWLALGATGCEGEGGPNLGDAALWFNEGGDKVLRDENRANSNPTKIQTSSVWDGSKVRLFGARNETVSFNAVIEAGNQDLSQVTVSLSSLSGPGGSITTVPATGDGVFNTVGRNLELFLVRYLKIEGLSQLSYDTYDERHVPHRMQRPFSGPGNGTGSWENRPGADKEFPEIAEPLEWAGSFNVAKGLNQSVWADITIPKNLAVGTYTGLFSVKVAGALWKEAPVELKVRKITLPDTPTAKTMVYLGYPDLGQRYVGTPYPNAGTAQDQTLQKVRNRHFQMAHRHRIALIDSDPGASASPGDRPRDEWLSRLNGSLFSQAQGYGGPGQGTGNGVYSIGTYGQWGWKGEGESGMRTHTNAWENWFAANASSTERFLYLVDESTNYSQTETWASWAANNPGVGGNLKTFATLALPHAVDHVPSLNIAASWFAVADPDDWEPAKAAVDADSSKAFMVYNGKRPATGSFATEDDGVALRQLAWAQTKMGVHRWFFWESTYYNDYQSGRGQTDVWKNAQTFGSLTGKDPVEGKKGWNYSNGDGVLFYPGTDKVYPASSRGREGPVASLRLKHWRRGIQDAEYVAQAMAKSPSKARDILERMVPKALWEYGVDDHGDPTWVRTDVSWSVDPDQWEEAREELADLID